MRGSFIREGNLGGIPETKSIDSKRNEGQKDTVANFSVYFDNYIPTGNPDEPFVDKGGFWMDVEFWGQKAERFAKLVSKGARVLVIGDQVEQTWADKQTGEERNKLLVKATSVTLVLNQKVETIGFGESRGQDVDVPPEYDKDVAF